MDRASAPEGGSGRRGRHRRARGALSALVVLAATALVIGTGCANVTVLSVSHAGDADGVTPTAIRVGGMGSLSGFVASSFAPVVAGARAYFAALDAAGGVNGRRIVYGPVIDDGTSPSGDLVAAQRLVQAKVFAVVGVGTPFFTGSTVLRAHGVPTFGLQENTVAQWSGPTLFGAGGSYVDPTLPQPQVPFAVQQVHAHRAAVLAYNVAQSSDGCISVIKALAQHRVPTPVIDESIPFGVASLDADVTRIASAGVDFVVTCMDASGNIKLSQTLKQHGLGSAVTQYWLDGYNAQNLRSSPAALDGVLFMLQQTPFEMADLAPRVYPGIDRFVAAMRRYAPGTPLSGPALAGWASADLFTQGLRAAGADVTRTRVVAAINRLTRYNAAGAYPPVDWTTAHDHLDRVDCSTFVRARGGRFVPVFAPVTAAYRCFDQIHPPSTRTTLPSGQVPVVTVPPPPGVPGR